MSTSLNTTEEKSPPPTNAPQSETRQNATPEVGAEAGGEKEPPAESAPPIPTTAAVSEAVLVDPELSRIASGPPYTVFSPAARKYITVLVTIASFVSPMTANIYFPALNPIAADLGVSTSLINLSLTSYMIFQGLSPTLFGDLGDMAGRRPTYILALVVYIAANIGLALQSNYAALLVLRCVQSAGSSGTLVLGYGVIADISSTADRGKYMGFVGAGTNVGPALAPVLGGLLSQYLGWRAIFWFCTIFVVVWLVPWVLTAPETCRKVVGNGSLPPQSWNQPLFDFCKREYAPRPDSMPKRELRFPNPLHCLTMAFEKETGSILLINAIIYLDFILIAATLATQFQKIYDYNDLEVGLCYLPYGFGCCFAVIGQGYLLDWNYRRLAKKLGHVIDRKRGDDLTKFPIEKARIQPLYVSLPIGIIATIGYGWSLEAKASVAAPLVLVFVIGMTITSSFNVLSTLIVDLHPEAPATATASNNLVRCLSGAAATAVINYMLQAMGQGWCFTFWALLIVAILPALRVIELRGMQWRAAKIKREQMEGM